MKKYIILLNLLFIGGLSFSQENRAGFFDDKDKTTKLQVGVDLLTMACGTANVNINYSIVDQLTVTIGGGAMPFGYIFDATDALGGEFFEIKTDINGMGYYFGGSFKYYPGNDFLFADGLGTYYGAGIEKWNYEAYNRDMKKTKYNFVYGYNIDLTGRFNLDLEVGGTIGTLYEYPIGGSSSGFDIENFIDNMFVGFNFGLGVYFAI